LRAPFKNAWNWAPQVIWQHCPLSYFSLTGCYAVYVTIKRVKPFSSATYINVTLAWIEQVSWSTCAAATKLPINIVAVC